MRLLQVFLVAGLLVSFAVAWPVSLFEFEDDDDNEEIYDYGDYYDYETPVDPEPEPDSVETPKETHDHHHHHHKHQDAPVVEGREVLKAVAHGVVPVVKVPKSCTQPPDQGVCRGSFPKFYYDPESRACLQFVYGGCHGNANVFQTAQECYEKCDPVGFTRMGGAAKDDYLTLHDGRSKNEFTFPGHDAALLVNDATLAEFSVRNVYQLEFSFRTDTPHGLLAFLRQTSVPPELGNRMVQLYVFIKRGHLGVTHIFCHNSETFVMKKGGVQAGNWHSSMVKVDAGTGQLLLEVDGTQETFTIRSLVDEPHYGSREGAAFTSRLWIGGVFKEEERNEKMVGRTANFHGCIRKVGLMSGETSAKMVRHKGLQSSTYRGVLERCRNHCKDRYTNMCSTKLSCVEHFDHSTCSCFGTGKDGRRCNNAEVPILKLSNDGHVVHRLYEWMDRVHSYTNFISMEFRTRFTDSILFYAYSKYPEKQYIAATLTAAGSVYVEANLGGGAVSIEVGDRLDTGVWQTLTILHQHNRLQVHLNSRIHELLIPGEVRYFHLDPDFYFGSAPHLQRTCGLRHDPGISEGYGCQAGRTRYYYDVHDAKCHTFNYTGCGGNGNNFPDSEACMDTCFIPGLRSMHSFLGCMRNVFINDVSVLWELKEKNKTTRYIGSTEETPFTDQCEDRKQSILLTLSTERAHVNLTNPTPESFNMKVTFRPVTPRGVVASGFVDILDTRSEWEIHHDETHVSFVIYDNLMHLKPNTKITIGNWQYVEVTYDKRLVVKVNQKGVSDNPPGPLTFLPTVTLGLSPLEEYPGMVGCVRKMELGGEEVDLRSLVGTDVAHKDATYDDCRVLGPCERPGACEHGTACTVGDDDEIRCNCTDSGYTGKMCYFSLYKSSCEEYRQIGYNVSGVYKIDVDGNGPLPPGYVTCEFNPVIGLTSTVVENNLREKYEVRGPGLGNMKLNIEYRDFSPEMLKALVTRDETCTQKATYECRRSPLKLSTHTWFESPFDNYVTSFGSKTPGLCRCREIGACDKYNVACNCDAMDGMGREDVAVFRDPKKLPLTSMTFLAYDEGQKEESEGRITLGPLTCEKQVVVEQAVSFSKEDSYLEVPAWREGSLAFSFKTTSTRAMLAFQPAYHPEHATFRIALLGEREVEFMYSFHGLEHRHSVQTTRSLNTGEWQQVLLDIHLHEVRFLVNSEQKLINIEDEAHLGVLDGSLFLGGMPDEREEWKNQVTGMDPMQSLRGCIRDLTVNHELVDIERYVRTAPMGVSSSCQTSCDSNPCKNGATCIEHYGSYECVCKNSLAHSGEHCEINPNEDAVTFTTEASKLKYFVNETANLWTNSFLNSTSLLLNFRTHAQQGLILFTYDYLHNFLQLHLESPTRLVLLFNSGKLALSLPLETTDGVTLNGGQSVQVLLERTSVSTSLTLRTNDVVYTATSDAGLQLLEDGDYEQFPFGESTPLANMVYYPHSFTRPGPFYKAYLGSADDSQWDVKTELPGLVGCLRGLQMDSKPVSLSGILNKYPAEGVRKDCEMTCDSKPCFNGGTCKEDFLFPDNFRCDCSGTSYTGPTCKAETAYTFHGREWLSRGSAISPLVEGVVLELAFSASTRHSKPQIVAFLRSTVVDHPIDYIMVAVEPDGTVAVSAVLEPIEPFTRFVARATPKEGVNAFSGLRHLVRVEWQSTGLVVMVDKRELEIVLENMQATDTVVEPKPRGLYLGGLEEGVDARFSDYDYFHGCISNVMVVHPEGKVYPLQEYSEHDLHITNMGLPGYGSCAGFPATPVMVMLAAGRADHSSVEGEPWRYREALAMPYQAPPPMPAPQRNTPMDNVVPAVAGTVLLVAGVVVAVLCVKNLSFKKNSKKKEEEMIKEEKKKEALLKEKRRKEEEMKARALAATTVEMEPLLPAQNGGTRDVTVKVTEKQEAVPLLDQPPLPPSSPPPAPVEDAEDKTEEVQTPKDTPGDRPLSWDKSADTLPLIIGTTEVKPKEEEEVRDSPSSSDGSSFEYTVDITGSPSSTPKFPPPPDSSVGDASPSSLRVHRGSNTTVNVDEDTDAESEPRLIRHTSLPDGDEPVVEEPHIAKHLHPLGDGGEVQKIVKSEAEDEIVVVDDYLDDKEEAKVEKTSNEEAAGKGEQQKEDDLAEAAQENSQSESEPETKTDQSFESAKEEQEDAKETLDKETDDKPVQEGETGDEQMPEEKKAEAQPCDGEETKQDGKPGDNKSESSSSSSDDDFVEVEPEGEKTWQEEPKNVSTRDTTTTSTTAASANSREDIQENLPTEELPITRSSNMETEEEEKVMMEKDAEETAYEEMEKTNDDKALNNDKYAENQNEVRNQEPQASEREDGDIKEPQASEREDGDIKEEGEASSQTQQEGLGGATSISSVPQIIVSSPKEEPKQGIGSFLTQIYDYKPEEVDGAEGKADIQDSHVSKDADYEQTNEQERSEIQDEEKERNIEVTEKGRENPDANKIGEEDSAKQPKSNEEAQQKQEDEVDTSKEDERKEKDESLGKDSDLPFVDTSQTQEGNKREEKDEDLSQGSELPPFDTSQVGNQLTERPTSPKHIEGNEEAETKQEGDQSEEKDQSLHIKISGIEGHFTLPDNGPASPRSDGDGPESPTYLNYVQEDDVCLENLATAGARCSPGNITPLDPISEQDESDDEKDEDKTRKTSLPTLFKSKFSSGMSNLTALSGDEDAAQEKFSSEDEAREDRDEDTSQNTGNKNDAQGQSSSEESKEDTSQEATPVTSPDATREDASAESTSKRKRRKKGHVMGEKQSPIFLGEGIRTFSNPVSYLGGPSIKYDEEEGEGEEGGGRRGSRQRNDSIVSTTSLD